MPESPNQDERSTDPAGTNESSNSCPCPTSEPTSNLPEIPLEYLPERYVDRSIPPTEALMSLFNPDAMANALAKQLWSIEEEVRILAEIARNGESSTARISAMKELRNVATDTMRLSGRMAVLTQRSHVNPDGTEDVFRSIEMQKVVGAMSPTEKMLRLAAEEAATPDRMEGPFVPELDPTTKETDDD